MIQPGDGCTCSNNLTGCSTICSQWQSFRVGKISLCDSFDVCWMERGMDQSSRCQRQTGSRILRRVLRIILGLYQQQSSCRLASNPGINYETAPRVYQGLRNAMYHICQSDGGRLKGKDDLDEAYSGGRRKGSKERGAERRGAGFRLSERKRGLCRRAVESVSANEPPARFRAYQEKIGHHHRYIPHFSFFGKVWRICCNAS